MRGVITWVVCCVWAAGCSASEAVAGQRGAAADQPATARWTSGVPVGLYFMTRFWLPTNSLEMSVWYFAPDGTVYESLTDGFSASDLAGHKGRHGRAALAADRLEITWADGKTAGSKFSPDKTRDDWDAGIFTAVTWRVASNALFAGRDSRRATASRASAARDRWAVRRAAGRPGRARTC